MSESKDIDVIVNEDGSVRFLYDDALADLIPPGYTCPIRRASNVEPTAEGGRWLADMRPAFEHLMTQEQRDAFYASVPVTVWPFESSLILKAPDGRGFATRAEALAAEVAWLKEWAGV